MGDVLKDWTPEQIEAGRKWVAAWKSAGPELERIRCDEIRKLNTREAVAMLRGDFDYTAPPRAPRQTSGLIEQQRWFMKLTRRE